MAMLEIGEEPSKWDLLTDNGRDLVTYLLETPATSKTLTDLEGLTLHTTIDLESAMSELDQIGATERVTHLQELEEIIEIYRPTREINSKMKDLTLREQQYLYYKSQINDFKSHPDPMAKVPRWRLTSDFKKLAELKAVRAYGIDR